jgi:hypothetical protein
MTRDTMGAGYARRSHFSYAARSRPPATPYAPSPERQRRIFDRIVWLAGAFFLIALALDAAAGERPAPAAGIAAGVSGGCHAAGDRHEQG